MKSSELAKIAIDIATKYKTLYVMGGFGAPLNAKSKKRYTTNHAYNKQPSRTEKIMNASADTFAFDCVCLFKGIVWGWNGDVNAVYGGAKYQSNGLPDVTIRTIANGCKEVSSDFTKCEAGEVLWNDNYSHFGICVGMVNGKLCKVEATPGWADGVQLFEMGKGNRFTHHGKTSYIEYDTPKPEPTTETITFSVTAIEKGMKGDVVKPVQTILKGAGFYSMDIDGSAGGGTDQAIRAWQKANKLTEDGVFGKACWEKFLDSYLH